MIVRLRGAEVDLERRIARREGQAPVELHVREADLLAWFIAHPVRPADRATLLAEVWGYRGRAHTRVVDVTVRRLREKIETDPSSPDHLLTVRGVGYRFEPLQVRPTRPTVIGREAVIAEILVDLDAGRTVTVCGLPGVGKSAVLDEIAARRPVARVDAGAVRDAEELQARLHAADHPDRVLIIDDLSLATLLARARAGLRAPAILVSAPGPLGLPDERVVQLGPLTPDAALDLYRRHARGTVDERTAAEICAALDHLPLAIVLAAAQRPEVPESVVLTRARHAPLALAADLAALPERHRHLRRALAVGAAAMPAWERRALAQLTVFAGWFDVDAAQAVVVADREAPPSWALLLGWIRRGWLVAAQPSPERPLSLRLLPLLGAGLGAELEDRERAEAELRHAAHFARMQGPDALARIDDLLLAVERITATSRPEIAAACWAALSSVGTPDDPRHRAQWQEVRSRWSRVRGNLDAAVVQANDAVAAARTTGDHGLVASTLYQLGLHHNLRGALAVSRSALEEAEPAAGLAGDLGLRARIRRLLAVHHLDTGHPELAWPVVLAADADLRAIDPSPSDRAEQDVIRGLCALASGDPDEARTRLEAADAWYADAGNRLRRAWTQNNLGEVARRTGALDVARDHYLTARALFAASGVDEVVADINLVLCASAADRIEEAADLVDDARRRAAAQGRVARIAVLDLARAVIAASDAPEAALEVLAEASTRLAASGYVDPDVAALADHGRARARTRPLQEAFDALAAAQRARP